MFCLRGRWAARLHKNLLRALQTLSVCLIPASTKYQLHLIEAWHLASPSPIFDCLLNYQYHKVGTTLGKESFELKSFKGTPFYQSRYYPTGSTIIRTNS